MHKPRLTKKLLILCDTNVWLALALSRHSHHQAACGWLDTVDETKSIWFCRATQQSFLRLLTNSSVLGAFGNPALTNRQALDAFNSLVSDARIGLVVPEPAGLESRWLQYASKDSASPKLWMDAYLAAFAFTGGYRLVTNDSAYRQFAGLDLQVI